MGVKGFGSPSRVINPTPNITDSLEPAVIEDKVIFYFRDIIYNRRATIEMSKGELPTERRHRSSVTKGKIREHNIFNKRFPQERTQLWPRLWNREGTSGHDCRFLVNV